MGAEEDAFSSDYPYAWFPDRETPLKDFITKYKPSMVQDDGSKPWIWVHKTSDTNSDYSSDAVEEATTYLSEVTEKIEAIKNDDSIPVRGNKKKGTKSKKEVREEVQAEATDKLKNISVGHKFVSGKWLIFAPPDKIDALWSAVATSLIEGPLADTCADHAKVATSPKNDTPEYRHVLCLYMPDVYNKAAVLEVMQVLLGKHGLSLMGVKSNLYTAIDLGSKHASGIQSTVWRNAALMSDAEMKELKDKYFADLNAPKSSETKEPEGQVVTEGVQQPPKDNASKSKVKLKKKIVNDDPFGSEDEEQPAKDKKGAGPDKKRPAARQASGSKRAKSAVDSDQDEEDERPKKKRSSKK